MKKTICKVLAAAMALSLVFGAVTFAAETEAGEVSYVADANGDGKIVVGYISKNFTDPFHAPINARAEEYFDQAVADGVIDEWTGILDGNTDAGTQIDRSADCISKNCDFVIILPAEAVASDPAVTSMAEAGINVIVVNSKTESTDDVAAAHAVAGSLRRGRHIVVVADDRHELIAILSNIVFSRGRRQVALPLGVLITDHLELIVRIKDVVHALGSLDLCAVSKHAVAVQILAAVRAVIKNPLSQKLAGVDIV